MIMFPCPLSLVDILISYSSFVVVEPRCGFSILTHCCRQPSGIDPVWHLRSTLAYIWIIPERAAV